MRDLITIAPRKNDRAAFYNISRKDAFSESGDVHVRLFKFQGHPPAQPSWCSQQHVASLRMILLSFRRYQTSHKAQPREIPGIRRYLNMSNQMSQLSRAVAQADDAISRLEGKHRYITSSLKCDSKCKPRVLNARQARRNFHSQFGCCLLSL